MTRPAGPRARRHAVMATVVAGYLLAALLVVAVDAPVTRPRWLALHLLGLGAATNAVFVWSRHFSQAVLHARRRSDRATTARLVLLNLATAAVLVGVCLPATWLAAAGGIAVAVLVAWHGAAIVAMARAHRLPGPLRRLVGFYLGSGVSLTVGAGFGAALGGAWVADGSTSQQRLHVAHAQLNLLGWIGLAVVGTSYVLWPSVLRTRMTSRAPTLASWSWWLCGTGLAVLVTGVLSGSNTASLVGGSSYAAGVLVTVVSMARTLPGQPSRTTAAWWLGAAVLWLLAGEVVDAVRVVTVHGADRVLHPVVPMLAVGLVAQVLVGALTFLVPVTVGGGPVGNRRMTAVLERGWAPRLAAANGGVLLVALPGPPAMHRAGWVLALVGLGGFLPLLAAALADRGPSQAG